MNKKEIIEYLDEIKKAVKGKKKDHEAAHSKEIELHRKFLEFLNKDFLKGTMKERAGMVLSTKNIKFKRVL